jgi:hypothetical protein
VLYGNGKFAQHIEKEKQFWQKLIELFDLPNPAGTLASLAYWWVIDLS